MIKYVAGLLFDDKGERVALVLKNRGPERLIGFWNAIGGKIEPEETIHRAMSREFLEETGVFIADWTHFLNLNTGDAYVLFFYAHDTDALKDVQSMARHKSKATTLDYYEESDEVKKEAQKKLAKGMGF